MLKKKRPKKKDKAGSESPPLRDVSPPPRAALHAAMRGGGDDGGHDPREHGRRGGIEDEKSFFAVGRNRRSSFRGVSIRREQDDSLISLPHQNSPRMRGGNSPRIPLLQRVREGSPEGHMPRTLDPLPSSVLPSFQAQPQPPPQRQRAPTEEQPRFSTAAAFARKMEEEGPRASGSFSARHADRDSTSDLREKELRAIISKLRERICDLEDEVNQKDTQVAQLRTQVLADRVTMEKGGEIRGSKDGLFGYNEGSIEEDLIETVGLPSQVVKLPRGAVAVFGHKGGSVLIGCPPDTVKDALAKSVDLPTNVVVPDVLFNPESGVATAEVEFPTYYSSFLKKKKVNFVCSSKTKARILAILQETLLGPTPERLEETLPEEFTDDVSRSLCADLKVEGEELRTFSHLSELVEFTLFDQNVALLPNGLRIREEGEEYVISEKMKEGETTTAEVTPTHRRGASQVYEIIARVKKVPDNVLAYYQRNLHQRSSSTPFDPPQFGVTLLGTSHGFDPTGRNTGMIIWVNQRGIVVDPPLDTNEMMEEANVSPRTVDTLILTHCHGDHDVGVLRRLTQERQITVVTTPTILNSFLRKYSVITSIPEDSLRRLFIFCPVTFSSSVRLHGASFSFHYSLHTIPALGFQCFFGGKSVYYAGDTCYDREKIRDMVRRRVMTAERGDFFLRFGWNHSILIHESGVPPIHTPLCELAALPEDVKRRLHVVHCSESTITPDTGLRYGRSGFDATLRLHIRPSPHSHAIELLQVMIDSGIFSKITIDDALQMLQVAKTEEFEQGQSVFEEGDDGDKFYIIANGVAYVEPPKEERDVQIRAAWGDGKESKPAPVTNTEHLVRKHFSRGDYFGEAALLSGKGKRTASVKARTELKLISFTRDAFFSLLKGKESLMAKFCRLAERRRDISWFLINTNSAFKHFTTAQKMHLQAIMMPRTVEEGTQMWEEGVPMKEAYLIAKGFLSFADSLSSSVPLTPSSSTSSTPSLVDASTKGQGPFGKGCFLCDMDSVKTDAPLTTPLYCLTEAVVFAISCSDLVDFFELSPGAELSLLKSRFADALPSQLEDVDPFY